MSKRIKDPDASEAVETLINEFENLEETVKEKGFSI